MKPVYRIVSHFRQFQTFAMNRMVPPSVTEKDSLSFWRVRILFAIIATGVLTGLFVFVPVVAMVIKEKLWRLLVFDCAVWLIGIGLLLIPGLKYNIRAGITLLVVYFMGVVIIVSVGPLSGGPAALFAFAVLVGVLLGSKAAIIALAINALTLTFIGWLITSGLFGQSFPFFNSIFLFRLLKSLNVIKIVTATLSLLLVLVWLSLSSNLAFFKNWLILKLNVNLLSKLSCFIFKSL